MSVVGKKACKRQADLWVFVVIPILVVTFGEAFKNRIIWRMRVTDLIDLVFLAPFFLVMLLYFNHHVFYGQKERKLYLVALGLMTLVLYGHAMHLTGNAINTYSTEIQHYQDRIPADTYQLIYFFDENLGHWLLYMGFFGSLGIWMMADGKATDQTGTAYWQSILPGGLLGLSYAIAMVESSQPWMGFASAGWLIVCAIWSANQLRKGLRERWFESKWVRFGLAAALMLCIGELVYLAMMGSFIQPSQIGF